MSRTFLIVDDSPVILNTLTRMLANHGIPEDAIHSVNEGKRALEVFAEIGPDVVLTDIDMPGMDGEEASKLMLNEDPSVKIVIVSGLSRDDERVRRLVSMGAFQVLEKPIRAENVNSLLNLLDQEESGMGRIR